MKIGLTGSIGTGKTTVSDILRERNIKIIDADIIARDIMNDDGCIEKIVKVFGNKVLTNEGKIDRRILSDLVFSNVEHKEELENITHPLIRKKIWEEYNLYDESDEIVVFDIPLLFETSYDREMDIIIVVACDEDKQLQRIVKRNGISIEKAELIINSQIPQLEKISQADYVIYNNGSLIDLKLKVNDILEQLETEGWSK